MSKYKAAPRWRVTVTSVLFVLCACVIIFRMVFIVRYAVPSQKEVKEQSVNLLRGAILDRHGRTLAISQQSYSIFANPKLFDLSDIPKKMDTLAYELGLSKDQLAERIQFSRSFNWLKRKISKRKAQKIKALQMKGIFVKKEYKRVYPHKHRASHLLGFTDPNLNGIEALEYTFNTTLQGSHSPGSWRFGHNIHLTIDSRMQDITRETLKASVHQYKAHSGTIVILNAKTGELLTMANYPDYDNNRFSKYPSELYRNTALVSYYEAGSVIKPFIVAIALEEKIIRENELIHCPESLMIQERKIERSVKQDHATVQDILRKSCNVGIIQIARRIPTEVFHKYLEAFGFGKKTGIELSGEGKGFLKDLDEITQDSQMNMSFGYEIGATPLQLTAMMAILANGGLMVSPTILHKVTDITGALQETPSKQRAERIISKRVSDTVLKILESVVAPGGTAAHAHTKGLKISGKTGTTQLFNPALGVYDSESVNTIFIGIVPQHQGRLVCFILLQRPTTKQFAATVSVPVFKKLLDAFLATGLILRNEV